MMHQIIEILLKTATNTLQSATVTARFRHCCVRPLLQESDFLSHITFQDQYRNRPLHFQDN